LSKLPERPKGNREAFLCPYCGAPYRELIPTGTVQVKCGYCKSTVFVPSRLGGAIYRCVNHPESLVVGMCNNCARSFCGECLFFIKSITNREDRPVEYINLCGNCLEKKRAVEKEGRLFCSASLIFLGLISFLLVGYSIALVFLGLLFIGMGVVLSVSGSKHYECVPTVNMVKEKVSKLKQKQEKIEDAMTSQEVEDLYQKILWNSSPTFNAPFRFQREEKISQRLEKYVNTGLSREDAILKMVAEEGIETKPDSYDYLIIDTALSDLRDELRVASDEREKEEKRLHAIEHKKELVESEIYNQYLYRSLLRYYSFIYGSPRTFLENKIESLTKKGLNRDESIKQLAIKEKIIEE